MLCRLQRTYFLSRLMAAAITLGVGTAPGLQGAEPEVELKCTIVTADRSEDPARWRERKLWTVDLKNAAGEILERRLVLSWSTIRFHGLPGAIYVLCVSGEGGESRCRSVDLFPPPGETAHSFEIEIEAPRQRDAHTVSLVELAVPEKAREEVERSEEADLQSDARESLRRLESALRIHPAYPDALNRLAAHFRRAGQPDRAIEYFEKATRIDPRFFLAWLNLSRAQLSAYRLDPALDASTQAARLRPDDPGANFQAGLCHYYLRRHSEARRYFERVVRLDPATANEPQLFLARIAVIEGRTADAEAQYRAYLDLHPYSPKVDAVRERLHELFASRAAALEGSVHRHPSP